MNDNELEINRFGLVDKLLSILNTNEEDDTKVIISKYLLERIDVIEELNIYDMAEECNTNRVTIRRFCESIGLNSFKDLKARYVKRSYYSDCCQNKETKQGLSEFKNQIVQMLESVNEYFGKDLQKFVTIINWSQNCVLLPSDIYSNYCRQFQVNLLDVGYLIRVIADKYESNGLIGRLTENDLLVVISVSGRWARETTEFLRKFKCRKALITSIHGEFENEYDDVYYISGEDQLQKKTMYHVFGIPYVLEILSDALIESKF